MNRRKFLAGLAGVPVAAALAPAIAAAATKPFANGGVVYGVDWGLIGEDTTEYVIVCRNGSELRFVGFSTREQAWRSAGRQLGKTDTWLQRWNEECA